MTQLQLLQYRGLAGAGGPCRQSSLWLGFGGMIGNTLVGVNKNRITKNETSFFASSHLPTLKMFTKLAVGKFDMKMVGLKNPFV